MTNVTAVHLWTQDDEVYAAALDGDVVLCAIEVDEVEIEELEDQVEEAAAIGDDRLADWLTQELAYGRTQIIGDYFELSVSL